MLGRALGFSPRSLTSSSVWIRVPEISSSSKESSIASGLEVLTETVELLNRPVDSGGCPWTNEQTLEKLVVYLQSELEEVVVALAEVKALQSNGNGAKDAVEAASDNLAAECGDVLFNALMLCSALPACENKLAGNTVDSVARNTAAKIRSRTPYMAEWGARRRGRLEPLTAQEAELVLQSVKGTEKSRNEEPGK